VFKDKSRKARKQIPAFIVVTISGSIVVLNLVYILSLRILKGNEHYLINSVDSILGIRLSNNFIDINLSTLIGAIVALFWNYNGYRLFVFKKVDNDATKEIKITV
jgi:putative flippase GtrA